MSSSAGKEDRQQKQGPCGLAERKEHGAATDEDGDADGRAHIEDVRYIGNETTIRDGAMQGNGNQGKAPAELGRGQPLRHPDDEGDPSDDGGPRGSDPQSLRSELRPEAVPPEEREERQEHERPGNRTFRADLQRSKPVGRRRGMRRGRQRDRSVWCVEG